MSWPKPLNSRSGTGQQPDGGLQQFALLLVPAGPRHSKKEKNLISGHVTSSSRRKHFAHTFKVGHVNDPLLGDPGSSGPNLPRPHTAD